MPISLQSPRKKTWNIECKNGGKSLEIGSEGKALIEDQKKGNRGLSCLTGRTEEREGKEGPARYQSVPLQFMAELNEVERGERQCHSTGRGPADSRVSHLADPFRRSSNLQLEM